MAKSHLICNSSARVKTPFLTLPSVKTTTLHNKQWFSSVQLNVDSLQHPSDVKIDLRFSMIFLSSKICCHLIFPELSLNEDNDGLQNGLTTVKLDLEGFEKAREANGEEIS